MRVSKSVRYEEAVGTSRTVLEPSNKSFPELENPTGINDESNLKLNKSGIQKLSAKSAAITEKDKAGIFIEGKR
jgi:hypothetical protein